MLGHLDGAVILFGLQERPLQPEKIDNVAGISPPEPLVEFGGPGKVTGRLKSLRVTKPCLLAQCLTTQKVSGQTEHEPQKNDCRTMRHSWQYTTFAQSSHCLALHPPFPYVETIV